MTVSREDLLAARRVALALLPDAHTLKKALRADHYTAKSDLKKIRDGNVHAVGVGRKIVNGKLTRQRCVRIYVLVKLPKALLTKKLTIPKDFDGIPVDIIESPVPWPSTDFERFT